MHCVLDFARVASLSLRLVSGARPPCVCARFSEEMTLSREWKRLQTQSSSMWFRPPPRQERQQVDVVRSNALTSKLSSACCFLSRLVVVVLDARDLGLSSFSACSVTPAKEECQDWSRSAAMHG